MNKKINNKSIFENNLVQIKKPGELNQKNIGELLKRLEDLNIVYSLNNAINQGKSLKEIIKLFSKEIKKLFSSLGATVYLPSENSKYLIMQNSTLPPSIVKKVENIVRIKIPEIKISLKKESAYSRALKQMKPQLINGPEGIQKLIYDFAETVKLKNKILHKTFKKITPKIYKLLNINSVLIVPLISNGKAIGVIDISREKPFRNSDLERFKGISGVLTTAVNKKITEDRLKSSIYESDKILETGIDGMRIIDKEFNVLRVNKQFCKISGLSKKENLAKKCFKTFPGEHCNKPTCTVKRLLNNSSHFERETEKVRTDGKIIPCIITALPLKDANGRIVSMVENYKDITERKKNEENLKKSYINLQKTLNGTIDTLASIVETRDPYTSGHQKRVTLLAIAISEELGLEKYKIEAIGTAALIHDIGKISIPASILARPGKISPIEYDMIKTHPQLGYEMIKRIEFPWPIANIILQHHERLDGSGYPKGLKGKDIVLEARILAVADVVEAMSSYRPYRPSLGIDKALKEVKKGKGKLYDPRVVEACIKIIAKKGFKF